MPDINAPPPTEPVAWRKSGQNSGAGGRRRQRDDAFARAVQAYGESCHFVPHDITSLHGIPEGELTVSVRRAVEDLMADVDRYRWALEQAEGRQAYLEGLADRDAQLPVLNRRAFDRELSLILRNAESDRAAGTPPILALFYLANFETLHANEGMAAAETALRHMADVLVNGVARADVVGATGGAGIGVVLTLRDPMSAGKRIAELRDAITNDPPRQGNRVLPMVVRTALLLLEPGMTSEAAVEAVDAKLRAEADSA